MDEDRFEPNYVDQRHNQVYKEYKALRKNVSDNHGELAYQITKNWYWNTLSKILPFSYSPDTIKKIVYNKIKEERSGGLNNE